MHNYLQKRGVFGDKRERIVLLGGENGAYEAYGGPPDPL